MKLKVKEGVHYMGAKKYSKGEVFDDPSNKLITTFVNKFERVGASDKDDKDSNEETDVSSKLAKTIAATGMEIKVIETGGKYNVMFQGKKVNEKPFASIDEVKTFIKENAGGKK